MAIAKKTAERTDLPDGGRRAIDTPEIMWNDNVEYALGLYKSTTRILGAWPLDKRQKVSVLKGSIAICVLIVLMSLLIGRWIVKGNCASAPELLSTVGMLSCSGVAVIQATYLMKERVRYSHIIRGAISDWLYVQNKESFDVMQKYATLGRLVTIGQLVLVIVGFVYIIVLSPPTVTVVYDDLHNESTSIRNLMMTPHCWIPSEIGLPHYLTCYAAMCLLQCVLCSVYPIYTSLTFGLAMHIVGQFELLSKILDELNFEDSCSVVNEKFLAFVKRHNDLLKVLEEFQAVSSPVMLVLLCVHTSIISLWELAVMWSFNSGNPRAAFDMMMRVCFLLSTVFEYCYIGEQLSRQTEKLQIAIYNCPWYTMLPNMVNNMRFIIMRNSTPLTLTAGKIYPMNYESFKNMVRVIFSSYTLLRTVLNAE